MPNDSRERILTGIRSALKQTGNSYKIEPGGIESGEIPRDYRRSTSLGQEECLHLFAERLREYDATVAQTQPDALPDAIAEILGNTRTPWIIADGFPSNWLPSNASLQWEAQATVEDLDRCAGVITVCSVAIALTGTIVLQHGPGEGRRQTSLLPDRHLCIVQASQVVETVPEAFVHLAPTRPLTFISGPSATADIEMTRIRGVHGPRQLDVILVSR